MALPFEIILPPCVGARPQRSDLVRHALHALLQSGGLENRSNRSGIGRLAVQAGREREFANLYRASDAARRLSDEEFAEVLKFTQAAFAMAVAFRRA